MFRDDAPPDEAPVVLIDELLRIEAEKDDDGLDEKDGDEEDAPNHLHAGQRNFFYRISFPKFAAKQKKGNKRSTAQEVDSLPIHCICKKPYCPALDIMHYCLDCTKWFHITCLEEWTDEIPELEFPVGELPAELEELVKMPIARGSWWGIGGNINVVAKARRIALSGDLDNWENTLALHGLGEWKEVSHHP